MKAIELSPVTDLYPMIDVDVLPAAARMKTEGLFLRTVSQVGI
jgi:hypothetical protein